MAKVKDITGQRFGRLTVLQMAGSDPLEAHAGAAGGKQ